MFKILDLFCGAGGMSHGMDMNPNFETVVAVDINEKLSQTLKENNPSVELIIGDIQKKSIKDEILKLSRNLEVNMVIGGPPCQGFSLKGKNLGLDDPRNFLFVEYLDIVKQLNPEVFVIENVKNILSASNGWFKEQILSTIHQMGYQISFGVLKATNYGVPQTRERAIFLCSRDKLIELPEPTVEKTVTVKDAIGDLAYLNSNEGEFEQEYITNATSNYQKMMIRNSIKLYNQNESNQNKIEIEKLKLIAYENGN